MRNKVLQHRDLLEKTHYIRKADPNVNYWFDFSASKVHDYIEEFGDNFSLIIVGDENVEDDYFVIPYGEFESLLSDEYLANDVKGRVRWIGSIKEGQIHITNCPYTLEVTYLRGIGLTRLLPDVDVKEDIPDQFFEDISEEINENDSFVYLEGKVLLKIHRSKERNRKAVSAKKKLVLFSTGKLACEVCGFDFFEIYGDLGAGFAECHHRVPLSELNGNVSTKLSDLAIVCSNCHSMLHLGDRVRTIEELKQIMKTKRYSS